jgi:predicted secreted hydrolase
MLYQLRHRDGKIDPFSSGTIIFSDGSHRHLPLKEFQIEVLDRWKSKKSGATYPSGWRVKVPKDQIDLLLTPAVKDQELIKASSHTYWRERGLKENRGSCKGTGICRVTGCQTSFGKI